jgi:hypothetical protein
MYYREAPTYTCTMVNNAQRVGVNYFYEIFPIYLCFKIYGDNFIVIIFYTVTTDYPSVNFSNKMVLESK